MKADPFRERRKPKAGGISVLGSNLPLDIGQVVVIGNYRHIITAEISREEFDAQMAASGKDSITGHGQLTGYGAIRREDFKMDEEPEFEAEYFYRTRPELARDNDPEEEPWA